MIINLIIDDEKQLPFINESLKKSINSINLVGYNFV